MIHLLSSRPPTANSSRQQQHLSLPVLMTGHYNACCHNFTKLSLFLFVCLFVYLEYIKSYIVTHTMICNQIFTQGLIPKQSLGTDFHWGPQIIYPRLRWTVRGSSTKIITKIITKYTLYPKIINYTNSKNESLQYNI